ncbi:MAG: hypothetical protein ACK5BQ_06835 [Ignavibacteria bacterium]
MSLLLCSLDLFSQASVYNVDGAKITITLPSGYVDVCKYDKSICEMMGEWQKADAHNEIVLGQFYPLSIMDNKGILAPGDAYFTLSCYRDARKTHSTIDILVDLEKSIAKLNSQSSNDLSLGSKDLDRLNRLFDDVGSSARVTGAYSGKPHVVEKDKQRLTTISLNTTKGLGLPGSSAMLTNYLVVNGRFFFIRVFVGSTDPRDVKGMLLLNKNLVMNIRKLN